MFNIQIRDPNLHQCAQSSEKGGPSALNTIIHPPWHGQLETYSGIPHSKTQNPIRSTPVQRLHSLQRFVQGPSSKRAKNGTCTKHGPKNQNPLSNMAPKKRNPLYQIWDKQNGHPLPKMGQQEENPTGYPKNNQLLTSGKKGETNMETKRPVPSLRVPSGDMGGVVAWRADQNLCNRQAVLEGPVFCLEENRFSPPPPPPRQQKKEKKPAGVLEP